jgi:hypothetical protein
MTRHKTDLEEEINVAPQKRREAIKAQAKYNHVYYYTKLQ